jgi:hypothetical protein
MRKGWQGLRFVAAALISVIKNDLRTAGISPEEYFNLLKDS